MAPGNNKAEILRVVPALGQHVEQVVLLGYPPFVKDVIDSGLDGRRTGPSAAGDRRAGTRPGRGRGTDRGVDPAELVRLNSEFAHYVPPERQLPEVVLRPAGDPDYFPVGVKHRYVRR